MMTDQNNSRRGYAKPLSDNPTADELDEIAERLKEQANYYHELAEAERRRAGILTTDFAEVTDTPKQIEHKT